MTLAALLLPAGCATDPFMAPGTWHAGDTNAQNLAAMVVNKRDLVEGEPMPKYSDGQLDAAAIDRLRQGKLKPLAAVTTSSAATASSGGSN